MLLIGILSVLQITLIPGFILIHLLGIKTESTIQKLLYTFALSLFLNYSLVTILTLLHLYTLITFYLILSLELLTIIILIKTKRSQIIIDFKFQKIILEYLTLYKNSTKTSKFLLGSAVLVLLFYFSLFISNIGTIFYFVDTVNLIHWNTWAKDFAHNSLPHSSSHFPQLIPTNWSIAYILTGNSDVNFFSKSFMPLFFFGNLLIFVDLAIWKKNYIYLIALIIYGLFAPIIYPLVFIADGNADLPVSFFTFLTFYAYLRLSKDRFDAKERLLFFLFAAASAATKLAGLYVFLIASIISLYGLIKYWGQIDRSKVILIFILVPLILAICFFWHLIKPEVMYSGFHQPEYVGENYILIFIKAAKSMYFNWGLPVLAFFILTLLGSLFVKKIRYITLIMVIPPLILWMLKYSADFRNLSFVVPFLSYISAFGLIKIIETIKNKPLVLDFKLSDQNVRSLSNRQKQIGGIVSILCLGLFCLIRTDSFYNLLLHAHKFISIHYFQSHRINLLTDYTQYIAIDYYQNVFAGLVLIIPFLYILTVTKTKLYQLIIIGVMTTSILNFSYAKEEDIIHRQRLLVDQVDARNYAEWMSTVIESSGLVGERIYTNFKTISTEKIPGNLEFIYLNDEELEDHVSCKSCKYLLFFKTTSLKNNLKAKIDLGISKLDYDVLYDDGDYLLISKIN